MQTANRRTRHDEGMGTDHVSSNSVSVQTSVYSRVPHWIVNSVKSKRIRTRIMAGNKYVDLQARLNPFLSRSYFNVFLECTASLWPLTSLSHKFSWTRTWEHPMPSTPTLGPFPGRQTNWTLQAYFWKGTFDYPFQTWNVIFGEFLVLFVILFPCLFFGGTE